MDAQIDILQIIDRFQKDNSPKDRYCSFDYCYNYFKINSGDRLKVDIEKSCLVLGFYLASWGMFRGSSFLLKRSVRYFDTLIEYFASLDTEVWSIDVDKYDSEVIKTICDIYLEIKRCVIKDNSSDLTLITKIMLGVFGFVPAFDQYFTDTFRDLYGDECGFRRLNENSLLLIKDFYDTNKDSIDCLSIKIRTRNFKTGLETDIHYPKAKIIDMYGFTKGLEKYNKSTNAQQAV